MTDPDPSDGDPSNGNPSSPETDPEPWDGPESMAEVHTRITAFARALRSVFRAVERGEDATDEELRDIRRGLEIIELALRIDDDLDGQGRDDLNNQGGGSLD